MSTTRLDHLRPTLSRICVALSGPDMLARAAELATEHVFFEFRLDTVPAPADLLPGLKQLLRANRRLTAIATCRRTGNGGHFTGSAKDECDLLTQAAHAGAHLVDLSLETAEQLTADDPVTLDALRATPAALLLSWHDFESTPDLEAVHSRMRLHTPDLFKIVPTAKTLRDSFAVLDLLEAHAPDGNLVAMAMGQPGILTRVLGPRFGSVFTFAAPDAASATAPGQVDLRTLRDLYRIRRITPATRIYGVFGKPISGSKSPVMLNTAFAQTDIDAVYLPLETDHADELFDTIQRLPLAGASVTMPLKEQILPRIDHLDPIASTIGAANTLRREEDGTISGRNTDADAIVTPLLSRLALRDGEQPTILVLGAGGAARAAVFGLRAAGAEVTILNRTYSRAKQLADEAGALAMHPSDFHGQHFHAIVNATPFGMLSQGPDAAPAEPPIPLDQIHCYVFFDLVYNPLETPMVKAARRKNCDILLGVEMFVAQGAAQFQGWTGQDAPIAPMRKAVLDALKETPA